MANYTMHHLNVGSDTYEIVDEQGRANIAPSFSASTAYTAGDYVIYGGKLYQFTTDHAAGAWTGADADEVTITEKLGGGSGDGLTEDIKAAMLQIAQKVAYIDEHGQDYYDDLYDALYPPADLVSISAVYTQSGTVYDTDTLDSLKSDLVVTAHYSDQTTQTVTTYTLSGTLTEGTSTITASFGGETATFSVTVTALVIPNGSFTFDDGSSVTVHNNHVQIFLKTHVHAASTGGRFVNLSSLNSNTSSIFTNANVNNQSTEYLSAEVGDVVKVWIKNATADNSTWSVAGSNPPYNVAMNLRKKDSSDSALSRAVTVYPADNPTYGIVTNDEVTDTVSSAYIAANLFCYIAYTFPAETTIDFDVSVSKE